MVIVGLMLIDWLDGWIMPVRLMLMYQFKFKFLHLFWLFHASQCFGFVILLRCWLIISRRLIVVQLSTAIHWLIIIG